MGFQSEKFNLCLKLLAATFRNTFRANCEVVVGVLRPEIKDSRDSPIPSNPDHGSRFKFSFDIGILTIFGHLDTYYKEALKKNYCKVDKGYNSFPNTIPGTLYNKAVLARKRISQLLSEIINDIREKRLDKKDLLGCLMKYKDEKGQVLTDNQIADNIIGVLFAAQDKTASALTWMLKFSHYNSNLLEAVKGPVVFGLAELEFTPNEIIAKTQSESAGWLISGLLTIGLDMWNV
ncbi:Abscisic acid 8'-hydroxylase, partial [Thalictrum thalictroides]